MVRLVAAGLLAVWPAICSEPGMVFIPGGDFVRGRSHKSTDAELAWYPNPLKDDTPARKIRVSPFYLDEAEVTNERYARFAARTRRKPPHQWPNGLPPQGKEKLPVVNVTWHDAAAFCEWEGKRLPTEAEWERASRGLGEKHIYPWGDRAPTPKDARYDVFDGPGAVCQFPRNSFGLCDIAGNVWEWTGDWYGRTYYAEAPEWDPKGPSQGLYRVLRGGSWFDQPAFLSSSYRSWARPTEKSPTMGFRCAKPIRAQAKR
jgi:formylglycine-generating enzyme required for sulfatase activity